MNEGGKRNPYFYFWQCPADTRYELARSLILAGGTCMLPGFKQRLLNELNHKVQTNKEYAELAGLKGYFGVVDFPFPSNILSWLGGTLMFVVTFSFRFISFRFVAVYCICSHEPVFV